MHASRTPRTAKARQAQPPFQVALRPLGWDLSSADALRLVRHDPHPVALLGAWADGSDIVASCPAATSDQPDTPFTTNLAGPTGEVRFGGGWIGYLGFAAAGGFVPIPPSGEPRRLPSSWFGYYDHILRRDRATGRWFFEALVMPGREQLLEQRLAELSRRARTPGPGPQAFTCSTFRLIPSPEEHKAAIRETVRRIRRGDIFQANICLRFEADFRGDPLDAFCRAAAELDPPYAAFLDVPGGAIASLSPELFLRRSGALVQSRPIKGTRPRTGNAGGDTARRQKKTLEASAKDQAENVMIVDLMRNDLSRVCEPGSVAVPALLRAEAHPGIWHLVSDVTGTLAVGTGDADLIRATFPPGSVTGAPKVRALEIIHELEATPREAYTGAIGYRSPAGLELNVAIRTFEFHGGHVWLGSGGGITVRSDPEAEYRECLLKAAPLIRAFGATFSESPALEHAPRPRPALGVFTSLRINDGSCPDLDAHLARLDASVRQVLGRNLPPGLRAELAERLAARPSGRLRIAARAVGGPVQVTVEVVPAGATPETVALRPLTIPGGFGAHKWQDRRVLDHARQRANLSPDEHLLIQDANGDILETDRASVFAVTEGILRTPSADGRILPGITRGAVLRLARQLGISALETPIRSDMLRQASEVFVTNSVHGIIPARFLAEGPANPAAAWLPGPLVGRLRTALYSERSAAPSSLVPAAIEAAARSHPARWGEPSARSPADRLAIILIDNYDSFTYNLAHMLLSLGCQVEVVRNDEVSARDVALFGPDGIVISPGPGIPAEAGVSIAVVRDRGPVTPLLGVCLGHQAIAAAHGAVITTAPEPAHGQATQVTHDGRGVLTGLPQHFPAGRYHSLMVAEGTLPRDLNVTARGPGGIPMGLRHTTHPTEGVQFHPESILTPHGSAIIRNFVKSIRRRKAVLAGPTAHA
jgi:para-aminobenzoate synthetase/4-amino-4-deoxychorismate lyase